MGRSEYELAAWPRWLPLVYALLVVNTSVQLARTGSGRPAWEVALGIVAIASGIGLTVWMGGLAPHRIVIDDEGVRLIARLRTRAIPWGDLTGLSHGRFDFGGNQLRWERQGGRAVTTSSRFDGLDEMLCRIASRVPEALTVGDGRRAVATPGGRSPAG